MAIDQRILLNKSSSAQQLFSESQEKLLKASKKRSAFLCHSHRDEKLVLGLLSFFAEAQIDLYIDWRDHTMPETPNKITAQKIQNKIKDTDVFLFLATANSKSSRWCPWEIGYADSASKNIYIVPTADDNSSYGNEYLDLYDRIDIGEKDGKTGLALFAASRNRGEWLKSL